MSEKIRASWWIIKVLLRLGSIADGSTCWFSRKLWDVHDYPKHKGGDGIPTHFFTYKCSKCGKQFSI